MTRKLDERELAIVRSALEIRRHAAAVIALERREDAQTAALEAVQACDALLDFVRAPARQP